ncbi:MAG: HAD-IIA family hydrolase [Candidatus Krumholzibacteriia bacterium]
MSVELQDLEAFLVDMDGVLYRGDTTLPGARAFLEHLQDRRIPHVFLTNNSSRTPQQYVEVLGRMGVRVSPDRILTSALVTAADVARMAAEDARILMVGSHGLREALTAAGLTLTERADNAAFVVVGLDRNVTYEKLAQASLAIERGARFLGTNADGSFPSERGLEPGTGALLAAIEAASGVRPQVYGKPEPAMFEQALELLGSARERTAMIGDRHETDIVGAARVGLVTIAVTTGAGSTEELRRLEPPPDFVFPSVLEIHQALAG